jgi:hemoglobin
MTADEPTIYETIGGIPAITAVVDDFYVRVLADPDLAGFFASTDMTRLKTRQVEFFAAALGGPIHYTGASMADAHSGRAITSEHFTLVVGHLTSALAAAGVPEPVIDQIVAALAPLADDIVTAEPAGTPAD